jgi:hypothetical protein
MAAQSVSGGVNLSLRTKNNPDPTLLINKPAKSMNKNPSIGPNH